MFKFLVQKQPCRDDLENGISRKADKSPTSKVLEEFIFNEVAFVLAHNVSEDEDHSGYFFKVYPTYLQRFYGLWKVFYRSGWDGCFW